MKNTTHRFALVALFLLYSALVSARSGAAVLKPGDLAPDFMLPDQNGHFHRLASYRGHTVVLAFYPADFTLG